MVRNTLSNAITIQNIRIYMNTTYLIQLNIQLQGREHLISDLFQFISAFEIKFQLWKTQLKGKTNQQLQTLCRIIRHVETRVSESVQWIQVSQRAVDSRWKFDHAPAAVQMQLIELRCLSSPKATLNEVSLIDLINAGPWPNWLMTNWTML